MNTKQYLPVWTDGLTYDEQHLVYWIANNMERIDQRYSFLPTRMLGNFFCDRDDYFLSRALSEVDFERDENIRWRWFQSYIMPLDYYLAQIAFDAAAKRLFAECPASLEITFGKLNENGIYDASFSVDYAERTTLFRQLLEEEIDKVQAADEFITYSQSYDKRRKELTYTVSGSLDLPVQEIHNFFHSLDCRDHSYSPRKNVSVDKSKIIAHYHDISEKLFILGNQYVKYAQNEKELSAFFCAAKNGDIASIKKFVSAGVDINSIDKMGRTAFGYLIGAKWDNKEHCLLEILQEMIQMGANPAIYGAGFDGDLLSDECLSECFESVSFLLECGVNPDVYPCIDEPGEYMSETLLERTERWAKGEPLVGGKPSKEQEKLLKMLKEFA